MMMSTSTKVKFRENLSENLNICSADLDIMSHPCPFSSQFISYYKPQDKSVYR